MRSTYTICAIVTIALSFFYSDAQGMKRTPKQVGKGLYEIVRASSGVPRSSSTGAPVITRVVTRATEATSSHSPQQRMNPSFTGNPLSVLKASPVAEVHPQPKTSQHSYLLESRVDKRLKRNMCTGGKLTVQDKDRNICARIQELHSDGVNVAKVCDIVEKEFPECKKQYCRYYDGDWKKFYPYRKLIIHAASKGYINTVGLLLDMGIDINQIDKTDYDRVTANGRVTTPLLEAIQNKHHNIAQLLLDHGATINKKALLITLKSAIWKGKLNVVKILCEIKSSAGDVILNHEDKKEALISAAHYSSKNVVKYFLNHHGFDIETRDQWGNTLLSIATKDASSVNKSRPEDLMNFLLDRGANIEARNNLGQTPLMMMNGNAYGDEDFLLYDEMWSGKFTKESEINKLFDCPLTSLLISRGANIEATDNEGNTALFYASQWFGASNIAITLLNAGASADHTNKYGVTPLMHMEDQYFKFEDKDICDMKKQKIYTDLSSNEKCRFIICDIFGRNYVSKS